ncbi:hypothetical protein SprV_0301191400 [Sparganum proliferum]
MVLFTPILDAVVYEWFMDEGGCLPHLKVDSVVRSPSGKETDRLIKDLMYLGPFRPVDRLRASTASDKNSNCSTYGDVEADMILEGRTEHILRHLRIDNQIRRIQDALSLARNFAAERELLFLEDKLIRLRHMEYQSSQLRHQIEDESISWSSYKNEMEKLKERISTLKAECLLLRSKICSARLQACEEHTAAVRSVDALEHSAKAVLSSQMSDHFDLCQQFVQTVRANSSGRPSSPESDTRADTALLMKTCKLVDLNPFPFITDALLQRLCAILSDSEVVQPVNAELRQQLSRVTADHNSMKTLMKNSSEREEEVCAWLSRVLGKISETVSSASKKRCRSAYFWDAWNSRVGDT